MWEAISSRAIETLLIYVVGIIIIKIADHKHDDARELDRA
jgi:hypothetical protein